jgi:primary-amine oxidase
MECKLTGIVATIATEDGRRPRYSAMIADRLAATHHQHIFCFRLDLDVDGTSNSVYEIDATPVPISDANPIGNAFEPRVTLLQSESKAKRKADSSVSRYWKITNPSKLNAMGEPVAYKLIPGQGTATLLADPSSSVARRAEFARHNLWVTHFAEDERHAAGPYPYQHLGGDGLPRYAAADRSLPDSDVVLWYCVGLTHFVRPEDWPVMPVERAGFELKPHGFFDRNPALDVPAPAAHCRHEPAGDENNVESLGS